MAESEQPEGTPPEETPQGDAGKVEYSVSGGLAQRLARGNISIAFTSYQSGLLYFVGRNAKGGINVHQAAMPKPMGLCRDGENGLTMTAGFQIMRFENVLEPDQRINDFFDACYVPRRVHVTGNLDAHDVGLDADGRVIFVNTRYNCLATTSTRHSFEMVWRPDFISALVDEDRCHLNGLAMQDGKPRYVTAVSRSDTIDGWRDRRADGGIVIDVDSGEIICTGLSMPHSPRLHNDTLWLLNSGTGELGVVTRNGDGEGRFEPRAFCPGFLRGLAFRGNFAFVGLSKPRYKRFEGLALDQKLQDADSEPWCGVQVIDLNTGACVDWFRIDGAVGELYDLEIIEGRASPMAVPPHSAEAANLITVAS
ncbi:MAG: TIGR03032 family protein [Alphaproteobacteria bacterium]|nr:TIGR03032 family protein [Alphaproteobacteria bacterium]